MKIDQASAENSLATRLLFAVSTVLVAFVLPCMALGWLILQAVALLS